MLPDYTDAAGAAGILHVHPETVKRLIRAGKLPATKFGNKWIIEKERLSEFANDYEGKRGKS